MPDGRTARGGLLRGGYRDRMLLAEDVLLLVTDDASGRLAAPAARVDVALGGASCAGW